MSPKVHTPTADVTAEIAGIAFVKGVGDTDDEHALNYFRRHGYRIEGDDTPSDGKAPDVPEGDPTDAWTKVQLQALAKRDAIELGEAKTKPEILAAILAARVPPAPPAPPAAPDATTPATPVAGHAASAS
jgi:hypothetical protein